MMDAKDILEKAIDLITNDRADRYGPIRDNIFGVVSAYKALTKQDIAAKDIMLIMILIKLSRQNYSHKDDNLVDIAGYAALGAEIND